MATGSFLSAGAGAAGAAPCRESSEGTAVVVGAEGISPVILMAGARAGAVAEADVEGGARPRPTERGGARVEDSEGVVVIAAPGGLPNNPSEGL